MSVKLIQAADSLLAKYGQDFGPMGIGPLDVITPEIPGIYVNEPVVNPGAARTKPTVPSNLMTAAATLVQNAREYGNQTILALSQKILANTRAWQQVANSGRSGDATYGTAILRDLEGIRQAEADLTDDPYAQNYIGQARNAVSTALSSLTGVASSKIDKILKLAEGFAFEDPSAEETELKQFSQFLLNEEALELLEDVKHENKTEYYKALEILKNFAKQLGY